MNRLLALTTACVMTMITIAGCTSGHGVSIDRHAFSSTNHVPQTIYVIDTVTDEVLFKCEVPAGHQLVLDFDGNKTYMPTFTGSIPATKLKWDTCPIDQRLVILENRQELSGNAIMIHSVLRPAPETAVDRDADVTAMISPTLPETDPKFQPDAQRQFIGYASIDGITGDLNISGAAPTAAAQPATGSDEVEMIE